MQTELAFTLAKNATKPNPVEIISTKTTRKENNWKTEETLAGTVVTLEMERIKLVQSLKFMMMMMMMMVVVVVVVIYPGYIITQKNCHRNYTGVMNEWKAVTKEYEEN